MHVNACVHESEQDREREVVVGGVGRDINCGSSGMVLLDFLESGSLTGLEFAKWVRLTCPQAPRNPPASP